MLQNRGLRCALNKGKEASTDELHVEAGLLKLKYRRKQHVLNFMYDRSSCKKNLKVKGDGVIVTRSQKKKVMKIRSPKTEKYKKSLSYRGSKQWNDLPEFHHVQDRNTFKKMVADRVFVKAHSVNVRLTIRSDCSQAELN